MLFPTRQPNTSWKPTALVIDKDAELHRSIHVMLGKEYDVHHAYFSRLALSLLEKREFSVVFTSFNMGTADEMPELHHTIQSISKEKGIPVIDLAAARSSTTESGGSKAISTTNEHLLSALHRALAA